MWLLLIVVLTSTPPHKHMGSIFNTYKTEAECNREMDAVKEALQLKNSKVTASCTFKDYLKN
jgi:hypothetical protein